MDEMQRAERFAGELAALYGDQLLSVVLYGSAARGEYRAGVSDLNLLVIVRELTPALLRSGSTLAREWARQGNPPPLLFDEAEWRGSVDVFPIEISDIRDAHRVLAGADPFSGVQIRREDLRHQCEHELRSKQIRLRERYLLAAADAAEVGALLLDSLPTFLTLLRTALRLAGEPVPRGAAEVIEAAAARIGFDAAPMQAVLRARDDGQSWEVDAADPVAAGYLDAVAHATHWLDGLEHGAA